VSGSFAFGDRFLHQGFKFFVRHFSYLLFAESTELSFSCQRL
jgi:hypothetical protein